jgi:hypothetical protein
VSRETIFSCTCHWQVQEKVEKEEEEEEEEEETLIGIEMIPSPLTPLRVRFFSSNR